VPSQQDVRLLALEAHHPKTTQLRPRLQPAQLVVLLSEVDLIPDRLSAGLRAPAGPLAFVVVVEENERVTPRVPGEQPADLHGLVGEDRGPAALDHSQHRLRLRLRCRPFLTSGKGCAHYSGSHQQAS